MAMVIQTCVWHMYIYNGDVKWKVSDSKVHVRPLQLEWHKQTAVLIKHHCPGNLKLINLPNDVLELEKLALISIHTCSLMHTDLFLHTHRHCSLIFIHTCSLMYTDPVPSYTQTLFPHIYIHLFPHAHRPCSLMYIYTPVL